MAEDKQENNNQTDLGLGDKVIQENRTRFINRDGTFNVHRKGVFERGNFSPYHAILNASWPRFFWGVIVYYVTANVLFTTLYILAGRAAFPELGNLNFWPRFWDLFFYSVQVISTLGSSPLHPVTAFADTLLALEAMLGLFGFAVGASLLFARFSNPATKILFSDKAVISPYKDISGFMVRIINGRSNELVQVQAAITFSHNGKDGKRKFHQLPLERDSVQTFPLNWTIVHPINEASPLFGKTTEQLYKGQAEFVVNITAIDEDLSKTLYARSSYTDGEIIKAKFVNILERDENGTVVVDPGRISEVEEV
jgi:inward rectifier potassium channel